jgi:hypothetical protein
MVSFLRYFSSPPSAAGAVLAAQIVVGQFRLSALDADE